MNAISAPLLRVNNIRVSFAAPAAPGAQRASGVRLVAVDGVSFAVEQGSTVGLVGESGCGKTTLGRTLAHFHHPDSGSVELEGTDLYSMRGGTLRENRRKIQMIFQNPYASLNPKMTIEEVLIEAVASGRRTSRREAGRTAATLLDRVGLDSSSRKKYPYEMSGGQRQRVAIARALAAEPKLIIADEPVSSLDVSVAARIINLFDELRRELQLTMLFISHDLSVVKHLSNMVYIMYRGTIVESGSSGEVFENPLHPYTRNLIRSVPHIPAEPGSVPFFERVQMRDADGAYPAGCLYAPRCENVQARCLNEVPQLEPAAEPCSSAACACFFTSRK